MINELYGLIAAGIGSVIAVVAIYFRGRKSGKESEKFEQAKRREKQESEANEANKEANDVAGRSSGDANREWLRNNATRRGD